MYSQIELLPFQGANPACTSTQGDALGYVLTAFSRQQTRPSHSMIYPEKTPDTPKNKKP